MKKLTIVIVGFILVVGLFSLWRAGFLNSAYVFGSAVIAFLFGSSMKRVQELEQSKRETEKIIQELKKEKLQLEMERELHNKEVQEIEEAYCDATFDELLAGANERERKRKTGDLGE